MNINLRIVLLLLCMPLILSGSYASAHTDVTADQARELIDSTDNLLVVDVREPAEYSGSGGHIPAALNYPWNSGVLLIRYEELPADGPVLVVCASGSRSNLAAMFLDSMGFSMVYDMLGGMGAWIWETENGINADIKYGGGTGEPDDPYQIATAEDLILLGESPEDYDKHFILTANIDLSGYAYDRAVIAPDIDDVNDGFQGTSFTGDFDGNGQAILNLTIEGESYLGLFGQIGRDDGAVVSNLSLEAVTVVGIGEVVGGLAGSNEGRIASSHIDGTVTGDGIVGGLVGINLGMITASSSNADVAGILTVGGLSGVNFANPYGGRIATSCSAGTVGGQRNIGGLVGANQGRVEDCFSTAAVSGDNSAGGLAGLNTAQVVPDSTSPTGSIYRCYAAGPVVGNVFVGGLVGEQGPGASVELSVWDIETSGQATSAYGTGKTTAEMKTASTFLDAGWDFAGEKENGAEDTWSICEETNYPRLAWQIIPGDFVCPEGITIDDFSFLMEHWLNDNCDSSNDFCQGTDLDQSGIVDGYDLEIFFENFSPEE